MLKNQFTCLRSLLKNTYNGIADEAYKECKLTRILRPIFEVNCKVVFIAHVLESIDCYEETLNVLSYSESLKRAESSEKAMINDEDIIKQEDQKFRKMSQENSLLKSQFDRMKKVPI